MPALGDNGRPVAADRKIRKKKKARTTRPAPVTQPGPFTDAEHKKVERNRSKPKYQEAVRAARKHGPATRRGTSPAGDTKGDAETRKGTEFVRKQYIRKYGRHADEAIAQVGRDTTIPPDLAGKAIYRRRARKTNERQVVKAAPVLKALEQTTRPIHGVAAGTRAAIKGKNVPKAVGRGLANKDKTTFSDVLKDVGAPKIVQSVGGFALDVGLDPTTYVTGGTASVARRSAVSAAESATKKALKAGLTKEQAKRMGARAATQTVKKAPEGRGVTVKFAGHEAPGVRRATAKVARGTGKVTDKSKIVSRIRDKGRHLVADVNPAVTPDNISRESFREVRRATRTTRSKTAREIAKTKERAASVKKLVDGADREILDAIESGSFRKLSPEKRAVAKRLQDQFKHARRLERRAGIAVGDAGRNRRVKVPEVTASVDDARKALRTAQASRAKTERQYRKQALEAGRRQGRAEVIVARANRTPSAKKASRKRMRPRATVFAAVRERGKLLDLDRAQTVAQAREAVRVAERHFEDVKTNARAQGVAKRRAERANEIAKTAPKGYVPHALREPLERGEGITSIGAKTIKPGFAKGRKEQRTLKELRTAEPGKYSEDAAVLYANRMIESHIASNKATLNRRLLDMGRKIRHGDTIHIGDGEKVFNVKGSNIREIDKSELQKFVDSGDGGKGGQYVVLNEQTVNRAVYNTIPASERSAAGEMFDKFQGGWKWLATVPNIGFHLRNLAGDAQNAYLAESVPRLAGNTRKAAKTLKRVGQQEERRRSSLPGAPAELTGKGVKVGDRKVSYHDLIKEAENAGAIRAGFINRELPELTQGKPGVKKIRSGRVTRPARSVSRFLQNREDLFRLATYIGGRNRGLSPEKAAERASKFHFDYADLTKVERTVLRRVAPFYTFSARNIPLQLTSYFARPGKFAQYQKIREEAAKAFGIDLDEAENNMSEYEQRAAPVVIKWKGEEFTLSFGPSGLPLTDLNEMPVSANPDQWADEWFQRATSMLSPAIKTPIELGLNYSFFFRDQIERDEGPLVPAPAVVGKMPKGLRDKLGVVDDFVDKRTGKKGFGWPAKIDYVANQFAVGPLGLAKRVGTESDREGEDTGSKLLAGTGIRVRKIDAPSAAIGRLYDEKAALSKKRAALNQRGFNAENPNVEWTKLSKQIRDLEKQIELERHKRGDKIVAKRGRPKGSTRSHASPSPSTQGRVLNLGGSSPSSSGGGGRVLNLGGGSSSSSGSSSSGGGRVLNLP